MSSVTITTRRRTRSTSYVVRYRLGGRSWPVQHAGSFRTQREARQRRDLIAAEIAAGRNPALLLRAFVETPSAPPGLAQRWDEFIASRLDVGEKARRLYRNARDRWLPIIGADTDPGAITVAVVQGGIGALADLSPATIAQYTSTLRQVLQFCDVEPNPASSPKLRLPAVARDEITPPTTAEWFAIRDRVRTRSLLPLRLIECVGLRISECVNLVYGDIDFAEGKLRVSRARTKTASGQRWLPVPDGLLDEIADLCPTEDRTTERRVFALDHNAVRRDLGRACIDTGVAAHGPHDLRHRRISLWLRHGFDPISVSRWAGHSRASMSLDTYGHVVLDPREDEWRSFWLDAYGRAGVVPVGSREAL